MTFLVTGASGNAGREVVSALERRGAVVKQAQRHPETTRDVRFDFRDPETWPDALAGVTGLFLMRPPPISDMGNTLVPLVAEARAQGVKRIAFLSVIGADRARWVPHHAVEQALMAGPRDWTLLRAGFFAQNLHDAYREDILRDDRLFVPAGRGKVAFLDLRDLGEVAAAALVDGGHEGTAPTLTGPEAIGFKTVAALLSEALGRTIRYDAASIPGYVRHLRRRAAPWSAVLVQTYLHLGLRFGTAEGVSAEVATILGHPATPLSAVIERDAPIWKK